MRTNDAPSRGKTVAIVLGVIGLAALVACLGVGLVLKRVADDFLGPPKWTDDALAVADLPKVFGVRTPSPPAVMRSRVGGFQDPIYEALVKLAPGDEAAFLAMNGLSRAKGLAVGFGGEVDGAKAELRARQPGTAPITVAPLDGFVDVAGGDGGYIELFRQGALLEADGVTWVYLLAFGT